MIKYVLLTFVVLMGVTGPEIAIAQEPPELAVKYVFWSPPKYSVDGTTFDATMGMFSTNFKEEFLHQFDEQEDEYRLVKRARTKFNIGNWLLAIPAGICFGIALVTDSDSTPFVIAGSVLAIGDIAIGVSAYRDLAEATDMRNMRLFPTVSLGF